VCAATRRVGKLGGRSWAGIAPAQGVVGAVASAAGLERPSPL
jgi:hypothetical protein